jgi:hypothetical protein
VTGGIAYLWLTAIDERGHLTGATAFASDDWRAAAAETAARVLAVDEAAAMLRPNYELMLRFNDHDLAGMRAALADDVVVHDRRRAGMGLVKGANAYLESLAALWRLTPDIGIDMGFELARERHGLVTAVRDVGTLPEGGTFERPMVTVAIVTGGRVTRYEFFELEDVDAALARFAELRPDPLRIPPNAATRALGSWFESGLAQEWAALETLFAPTLALDDRRRLVRTAGGRDMAIASTREVVSLGVRPPSRTLLATAGDRLALERVLFVIGDVASESEVDSMHLVEVDGEGRVIAVVVFDPDDRRAAAAEMLERYARSEAARVIPAAFFEGFRAYGAQDLDRIRAAMSEPFMVEDWRRTGAGRLDRVEDHVAFAAAFIDLAPGAMFELVYVIAAEKHGLLAMARGYGTAADGGEFESVFVLHAPFQGDRVVGLELFEPEHLEAARARFEALRLPQTTEAPMCPPESRKTATSS